jgi:uncharacterized protein (DUF302 family)
MIEDLIIAPSPYSVAETIDRLAAAVTAKGLRVFARIDHGANATEVGLPLRPIELLVFGNPRGGTPLMQDKPSAGIDLPLHALAYEETDGVVRLAYTDPKALARRHGLGAASAAALQAIEAGMAAIVREVTASEPASPSA